MATLQLFAFGFCLLKITDVSHDRCIKREYLFRAIESPLFSPPLKISTFPPGVFYLTSPFMVTTRPAPLSIAFVKTVSARSCGWSPLAIVSNSVRSAFTRFFVSVVRRAESDGGSRDWVSTLKSLASTSKPNLSVSIIQCAHAKTQKRKTW